jgi:hypothetical protein
VSEHAEKIRRELKRRPMDVGTSFALAELDELVSQRDELAEALESVLAWIGDHGETSEAYRKARAALGKVSND